MQNWFKQTYGYHIPGWEKNFAEACGYSCGTAQNRAHYDMSVAGYEAAFRKWKGGKYLQYFKPKYVSAEGAKFFFGVQKDVLFIDEDIGGVQTPAELYHLVDQIIAPASDLTFRFLPGNERAA
ncbi:hypothetical protein P6U16_08090 [Rhizobium sp. 32-5/1]|uniref:hypothetical protein n=1 Tax=Rhizobium sp. 32-5/1 TaxID=3019602 RepID=UPI00240D4CC9|nr:hypothetical protein [Rhizobium sp. 32-5/1]WEZ84533.1 hypothetical protein P6U16_08090 [Rhizobium sp. 32-5/1]